MAYATEAQLTDWLTPAEPPATEEAGRLLSRASGLIDRALVAAIYDVDDEGLPTAAETVAALGDATCAQVEWWLQSGDELGHTSGLTSMQQGPTGLAGMFHRLAPRARDILIVAGLSGTVEVS